MLIANSQFCFCGLSCQLCQTRQTLTDSSSTPISSIYQTVCKPPAFLSIWSSISPGNKCFLHPHCLQKWILIQIIEQADRNAVGDFWCWVMVSCLVQNFPLSRLGAGLSLARAHARALWKYVWISLL